MSGLGRIVARLGRIVATGLGRIVARLGRIVATGLGRIVARLGRIVARLGRIVVGGIVGSAVLAHVVVDHAGGRRQVDVAATTAGPCTSLGGVVAPDLEGDGRRRPRRNWPGRRRSRSSPLRDVAQHRRGTALGAVDAGGHRGARGRALTVNADGAGEAVRRSRWRSLRHSQLRTEEAGEAEQHCRCKTSAKPLESFAHSNSSLLSVRFGESPGRPRPPSPRGGDRGGGGYGQCYSTITQ